MVQERGEPQLPILLSCLTYPLQRTGRVVPARCPGRVLLARVPLARPPSLHPLRRRLPGLVRGLLQVLRVCPTSPVRTRRRGMSLDFPTRPRSACGSAGQGSASSPARCFRTCTGSLTARDSNAPRNIGAPGGAFRFLLQRRRPGVSFYAAEYPAHTFPCPRFVAALASGSAGLGAGVGR